MASPELLISVVIIGILALIVAVYLDRTLAVKQARDLTRFNHTQVFLGSILRYEIDTKGAVPPGIDDDEDTWQMIADPQGSCSDICENKQVVDDCADLSVLVPEYIDTIPQDPFFTDMGGSGYYINKRRKDNIVTVGACISEVYNNIEIKQ